jgi:RHS repeat-associated protein
LDTTGLYFYNARYYDPAIGRFISADSIIPHFGDSQSLNRYSYCLNNPLKYIDPNGHDDKDGNGYDDDTGDYTGFRYSPPSVSSQSQSSLPAKKENSLNIGMDAVIPNTMVKTESGVLVFTL